MKTKALLLLATALCGMAFTSCSNDSEEPLLIIDPVVDSTWVYEYHSAKAIPLTVQQQHIADQLSGFSWHLLAHLYDTASKDENIIYSPFSVEQDLAMLLNGMQGSGRAELLDFLGLDDLSTDAINDFFATMTTGIDEADNMARFSSANSLWYAQDRSLNPAFKEVLEQCYQADIFPVTFTSKTAKDINQWCSDKTFGRIPTIVEGTSPLDIMHLINAVYFRSNWAKHFDETASETFTTAQGKRQQLAMMKQTMSTFDFQYAQTDHYQLALLPFNNGAYRMAFILPDESSSMAETLADIAEAGITYQYPSGPLHLTLPKFQVAANYDLAQLLTRMGCNLFAQDGDNFRIFTTHNAAPSGFIHKAFLTIDEYGAEAAAASDLLMEASNGDEPIPVPIYLTFNRPFLFALIENSTGYPLFLGCVNHVNETK